MTYVLTEDDIEVGDVVSTQLEKMWWWYLIGGIISMIFGFFVISYRHPTVYAVVYLASGFFIVAGVFQIIGSIRMPVQRWLHIVFGITWIGVCTSKTSIVRCFRYLEIDVTPSLCSME